MTNYLIAAILAAEFATACGFLAWTLRRAERIARERMAAYEGQIELLRREKELLLNTALEAKGVQVIDPNAAPQKLAEVARQSLRQKLEGGLARLQKVDQMKAQDRDADVAAQIEEARRASRQAHDVLLNAERDAVSLALTGRTH